MIYWVQSTPIFDYSTPRPQRKVGYNFVSKFRRKRRRSHASCWHKLAVKAAAKSRIPGEWKRVFAMPERFVFVHMVARMKAALGEETSDSSDRKSHKSAYGLLCACRVMLSRAACSRRWHSVTKRPTHTHDSSFIRSNNSCIEINECTLMKYARRTHAHWNRAASIPSSSEPELFEHCVSGYRSSLF